jgi:hypothetical protein
MTDICYHNTTLSLTVGGQPIDDLANGVAFMAEYANDATSSTLAVNGKSSSKRADATQATLSIRVQKGTPSDRYLKSNFLGECAMFEVIASRSYTENGTTKYETFSGYSCTALKMDSAVSFNTQEEEAIRTYTLDAGSSSLT